MPKPVGAVIKNPELAASLELIAKGGAAAFYTGPLAQSMGVPKAGVPDGVIDCKLNIQQAINLPNFGAQISVTTSLERLTLAAGLEAGLKAKGHTIAVVGINSGLHGITFNGRRADGNYGMFAQAVDKKRAGGADSRREGAAAGN